MTQISSIKKEMEKDIQKREMEKAIQNAKEKKACFNCVHKQTCSFVETVLDFKMDKFVRSLLQVNVYDAINEAMGKNCFHFKNIHEITPVLKIEKTEEIKEGDFVKLKKEITEENLKEVFLSLYDVGSGKIFKIQKIFLPNDPGYKSGEKYKYKNERHLIIEDKEDKRSVPIVWHIPISFVEKI